MLVKTELLQECPQNQEKEPQNWPLFEIIVRTTDEAIPYVDVAYLQSRAKPHSMFQVASNFNCAEVPSPWTDMSGGRFVSNNACFDKSNDIGKNSNNDRNSCYHYYYYYYY